MIELQDVSVVYGQERTALSHVSLRIKKGEFVFIVGSTGSGKSTLLKLLYREQPATRGRVIVNHQNLTELRHRDIPFFRRRMGVVFQDFGLLPNKTVFENVAFALRVIGTGRREIRKKVPAVLDLVGLTARCDAFPHQISGGEQQRHAIARALVNDPPLLIADEPTGNLDPDTSLGIYQTLAAVNERGTTVVVATHDHAMVDAAQKRVIEFDRGRVVRDEYPGMYSVASDP
jgi:cell division transport system ATP-binding protein